MAEIFDTTLEHASEFTAFCKVQEFVETKQDEMEESVAESVKMLGKSDRRPENVLDNGENVLDNGENVLDNGDFQNKLGTHETQPGKTNCGPKGNNR